MEGFGFSLADNTCLREDHEGYFLHSRLPLRILRINESLFRLLQHIREGGSLSGFVVENPGLNEGHLLRVLLSLSSRGYLKLEKIAEIEQYPVVSVIIPVRDQPDDLLECLQSLDGLNYPADRLEIIVVDDGSEKDVSQVVDSKNVRVIRQAESKGQAACRNIGAEAARGDILAFLDADCMAGEDWLRETIPFFQASKVGAVGGYVDGYYKDSFLDRYEAVASSLNMGKRLLIEGRSASSFYVPTANMLVARDVFTSTGGFRDDMRVGEDVDFCWRLRELDHTLIYVPFGKVSHKHRNHLFKMLKRRADYGTSEAVLYRSHRNKRKVFSGSVFTGLTFLALVVAVLLMNPYPVAVMLLMFGIDLWRKSATLKKFGLVTPRRSLIYATFRSYLSFFYFAFFHLLRYYLIPVFGLGFLLHSLWLLGGLMIIYTSIVDYYVKKPKLIYPVFLFFYLLEHLAYQLGVFWGCVRRRYFGSYLVAFRRA
jgi:mycofactocin system glycosyltransferase